MIEVGPDEGGQRLDSFLAQKLDGMSRSRIQALIKEGRVRWAAGVVAEPSWRVKPGEPLSLEIPEPEPARPAPEAVPLEVLLEDEHLIVVHKPAGMVVHPAPGHAAGTLVNALLAHCGDTLSGIGGVRRPGIVHRIDRDVSGVLVVAKHDRAHVGLAAQFTVHSVHRVYDAIVRGVPATAAGRIDAPLARDPHDRLRMAIVPGGKRAVTHYRLTGAAGLAAARLDVRLETGRTHQIRVHLSSRGHPILGDRLYDRRPPRLLPEAARAAVAGLDRLLLHARELGFTHPLTGARIEVTAPSPPVFDRLLELLRD